MKTLGVLLLGSVSTAILACGGSTDPDLAELDTDYAQDSLHDSNYTYFQLRPDLRRCAAPLCGGFFVRRPNRARTRCADGAERAECYVADLDLSSLGWNTGAMSVARSRAGYSLMRGSLKKTPRGTYRDLATLQVTEVWNGHEGGRLAAKVYRVKDSGIRCITYPCPSLSAALLNTNTDDQRIAGLNLDDTPADHNDALAQLSKPGNLLISANTKTVSGPGGTGIELHATEYYLPFVPTADGPTACGSRGLAPCASGQYCKFPIEANCGRTDAPGTCAVTPTVCTLQYEPVCGCDAKTYSNACVAASAGVSVESTGVCHPMLGS